MSVVAPERPVTGEVAFWRARAEAAEARLERVEVAYGDLSVGCAELKASNAELGAALRSAEAENTKVRARLEKVTGDLATLRRMVFGDRSEKGSGGGAGAGPDSDSQDGSGQGDAGEPDAESDSGDEPRGRGQRRGGPGPRRRDYSQLPTIELIYDLDEDARCCPGCGQGYAAFDEQVFEQVDWRVVLVRLMHRRRRYSRTCRCAGPRVVTAAGPGKAIGKGRFTSGFLARLLVAKFLAGQPLHRITTGLARDGLAVPDATLTGAMQQVGDLLVPLETAIAARNRTSAHLHVDETTWKVFEQVEGKQGTRWWLWVFVAADSVYFRMDPTRKTDVATDHLGIDLDAGTLATGDHLVISSDFYTVYQSIAVNVEVVTPLWCWAHIRRYFVRAGDAHPKALGRWSQLWLDRIRDLYIAHRALAQATRDHAHAHASGDADADAGSVPVTADSDAAVRAAQQGFDDALAVIDTARHQQTGPALHPRAQKVLATLDREWEGLVAHRDFPLLPMDNNAAERALRTPVVGRKNYHGSTARWAAYLAARVWTITATIELAGLNPITYLTAYLDACGANGGKPLPPNAIERFLPWTADPADLATWAAPPRNEHAPDP